MAEPIGVFGVGTDLQISALANDRIVHGSTSVNLRDAAKIMDAEGVGLLVLKDGDSLAGVVSERDVLRAVAAETDLETTAISIVKGDTFTRAAPTATVREVGLEMMENYIRHVLITDADGELIGVVSIRDLLAVIVN